MDNKLNCEALMEFTGLDQESTMTQILPYLNSINSRAEVEEYLGSLIGQGQKQTSFIQRFSDQRFRTDSAMARNQNKVDAAFPSLQSTHKPSSSSLPTTSSTTLGNFPIKTRGGPSTKTQSTQPKKQQAAGSHPTNPSALDPKIYNNFGNSANVYLKSRDSDDSQTKSSKKRNPKSIHSGTVTPEPRFESTSHPGQIQSTEEPAAQTDSKPDTAPDIDIPISELSPSTLKELLQLKIILDCFESETATPKGTAKCFCEARSHGLPIGRLPKQCTNCGLIYCKLKAALSSCPSCSEPTPLSTNNDLRTNVCAEFVAQRNGLIKLEIEKYQKRISLELKKAQAQEADRAYPSLPSSSTPSRSHSHNQQPASHANSYSNQLHPGASIQNRIKLGYGRLAEEHNLKSNNKQSLQQQQQQRLTSSYSHQPNTSHTVLRLNSSNGKTKIIKTTKKNPQNNGTPKQQELLTFNQVFDPEFAGDQEHHDLDNPPYLDTFDDLLRLSSDLQPSLFVDQKLPSPHQVPEYVPVDVYQV
ncbi:hypothetical protein PGTUg99_008275 [Puccinia graminis f. sp. tritici]|uniref:TRIP4/RQT4 C2HC5-type zinc finger domain-containing protein n=1 Tax=Puccinia graminis f. sp. tritici TaxID=56615 RepID=A0A5B0MYH1_PUCGR|nr:hypothetical protein PGTUg99_008275 [Puccinia graminis f. sp. tritici]